MCNHMSHDVYVSPNGSPSGAGTTCSPLDLDHVSSQKHYLVHPGVTIHLMAGDYEGDYTWVHSGESGNEIAVKFEPGARIKGNLTIDPACQYTRVINLYAFTEPETRWTEETGSAPSFAGKNGLTVFGAHCKAIHPFVRDVVASGIGFWQSATDSLLYGAWLINNGWLAPDRGHGHNPYGQGPYKIVRNCMIAQNYGGGIRMYTSDQVLTSTEVSKCITINDVILYGGGSPASGIRLVDNVTWNQYLEVGETNHDNDDVLVSGNYTVTYPGNHGMVLRYWRNPTITDNVFVIRKNAVIGVAAIFQILLHDNEESFVCDNNVYYIQDPNTATRFVTITSSGTQTSYTQAQWQALGRDLNSQFIHSLPTTNHITVNHSEYDDNIAHVAVHNWEGLSHVSVDFSGGNFSAGRVYRAFNAMNPDEYYEFTFDGAPVAIPMTGWSRSVPVGDTEPLTEDTWPDFAAFVVKSA